MKNAPVYFQLLGAVLITAGFGVWLGAAGALICGGVCAILGGTTAELLAVQGDDDITEHEEGVNDAGPGPTG
jgi:hypothetical protein